MARLCTYIMTHDSGLAPNPFWGWCTLAVCTPNHQGARVEPGDWIAGFTPKGEKLIYAMEVSESAMDMDDYFHDPRFANKKPRRGGSWQERCGDNFYSRAVDGGWQQHWNLSHMGKTHLRQDTRHPKVFISKHFWYFGREAIELPSRYAKLVGTRGIRVNHPVELVDSFMGWLNRMDRKGQIGMPREMETRTCCKNPPSVC
ncbi:hypothetical protein [Pseudomonas indica]|uniref:Nmad2 family putative nucleotide modification protein n=1 Tax=Pseudomonas indica TaxID=137658 RepID=UPI001140A66C|nr:hypothetical protein [Pseudomonas indica]MBU3055422.1 hypothetical protein [Pseudomonas indica]